VKPMNSLNGHIKLSGTAAFLALLVDSLNCNY